MACMEMEMEMEIRSGEPRPPPPRPPPPRPTALESQTLVTVTCDSAAPSRMEGSAQGFIPKVPLYTALKFMATSALGLAALKNQGLFEANPVPAWCFLGTTFGYCVILGITKQMQFQNENGISFQILTGAAFAFGLVSAASLVSIFLPHQFSFVPLIMLTPLSVILAWPILRHAYNWLCNGIKSIVDKIRTQVVYWTRSCNSTLPS